MFLCERKPSIVKVVKFIYGDVGIAELKELCGDELKAYGKSRGIFEAGWAWIGADRKVAVGGNYVVKENDKLYVYTKEDFFNLFSLV
jgi:hypothetical protein